MEIWKDIPNIKNYQVSNLGRIKSLNYNHTKKEKIMKQTTTKKGYKKVTIFINKIRKTRLVHQLVAQAFLDNPENNPFVLHKKAVSDGGTNCVDNLYWGTNSDNMKDRVKDGHFYNPRLNKKGKDNPTCMAIEQYDKENNFIKRYDSITEASEKTNINYTNIARCCKKDKYRKTAGGYIWKYEIKGDE